MGSNPATPTRFERQQNLKEFCCFLFEGGVNESRLKQLKRPESITIFGALLYFWNRIVCLRAKSVIGFGRVVRIGTKILNHGAGTNTFLCRYIARSA